MLFYVVRQGSSLVKKEHCVSRLFNKRKIGQGSPGELAQIQGV